MLYNELYPLIHHNVPSKSKHVNASKWTNALNVETYIGDVTARKTLNRLQMRNKGGNTITRKAVPKKPFST